MAGNKSATLTIVIAGDAKGLSKSLKGTESQVASLGAQFKKMAGAVGIGLGTAAVIKFGKDSVSSYANAGREVLKLKRLTGETAEQASLLRFAAQQSGVSTEQMAKAWVIFSKNIQSGKIEAAGIAIKGVNGEALSSDKILANTADKFAGMANGYQKTALAASLFGKSGAALLPFLDKGSAGVADLKKKMDELGVGFDEAGLQKVKDYTAAQRDMSAAVEGLKLKIGSGLMPIITSLTETISTDLPKVTAAVGSVLGVIGDLGKATGIGGAAAQLAVLGVAVSGLTAIGMLVAPVISTVISGVTMLGSAVTTAGLNVAAFGETLAGLTAAEAAAEVGLLAASMAPLAAVVAGAGMILYDYRNKAKQAAESTKSLHDEVERTGGTLKGTFTAELAKAIKGVTSAFDLGDSATLTSKSLQMAGVSAGELTDKLSGTDARFKEFKRELARQFPSLAPQLLSDLDMMRAAYLNNKEATKAAKDEQERHTKELEKAEGPQKRYEAGLKLITDAQAELEAQGQKVNDSIVKVAEAQDKAAQAAQDVTDAEKAAVQADRAVVEAKRAVQDAIDQVAQARRAEEANIRSLADAEKGEAQAAKDVAQAQADLAQKRREATGDSDAMRSALGRVVDAEKALRQADEDSEAAQRRLTEARQNYGNVIADLQDKATSSQLDVNDAQRRLREAQQNLANLGKDGKPVTGDDRGAAQDAVTRAEIALRQAQKDAAAAQAELNKEQKAGADGSTAVVDAQDAVTAAAQHQADAHRDLETAVQNVADTQVAADKAVADAESTLAEKIDARQAAHQRVLDAKQAVVDGNAAIQKAAEGVRDAEQQVADRQGDANTAHQDLIDKKAALVTALGQIHDAEWAVAMAYAAEADARQRIMDLANGRPGLPGVYTSGGTTTVVGGGPHGHDDPRSSTGGKGTPADGASAGTKDNGSSGGRGRSSAGLKAPEGSTKPAHKPAPWDPRGHKGNPPDPHPGLVLGADGKWYDPIDEADQLAAANGAPAAMDADYYAWAIAHPPKSVAKLRRPPREIHNTFHLYGVTDMQTQATLIAREQSLQLALAGGH